MNEFDIIKQYFAPLAGEGAFSLKDDAALITSRPGFDLVVTTDAISEGTDFFAFDPAGTIAQKALRVNLSDLAAKGAEPFAYLLNLSLPHSVGQDWLAAFAEGLGRDQREFGISLLGGDTGATDGPLTISVTAFGYVPQGKDDPPRRRARWRCGLCHRQYRRGGGRPCHLQARKAQPDDDASATSSPPAIACRSRRSRLARACARSPMPRLMCPTD